MMNKYKASISIPKYEYIHVYKYIGNCPHPATFLKGIYQGGPLY